MEIRGAGLAPLTQKEEIQVKSLRTVIHGTRTIMGTEFPVESILEKSPRKPGGLPGGPWLVTIRLCNGVSEGARRFRTKREAMAFLDRLE